MERHFELQLEELKERLLWMGSLAERALHKAVHAVLEANAGLAHEVEQEEEAINEIQIEIDERVLRLMALHQLMAVDLRFVLAVTRINADLERIGDQAVNIAEASLRILQHPQVKLYVDLPRMSELAEGIVKESLEALVQKDVDRAREALRRDDEVDQLRDQILRELLTYMMGNPSLVLPAFDLILVARNLERTADLATNIAEDVIYMVAGRDVRHPGAEAGRRETGMT